MYTLPEKAHFYNYLHLALAHLEVALDYGIAEKGYLRLKNKIEQRKGEKYLSKGK